MKHEIKNTNKGVSILFAVFIMAVILAIALGISAILIQQIKMMADIGDSVVAFYAADCGIEEALYYLYRVEEPEAKYEGVCGPASFEARASCPQKINNDWRCPLGEDYIDPNCDAENYCLKSIGVYQKTMRGIEIQF